MIESALYEGWVAHRRLDPVEHSFRYPLFMAYLDLDELPGVLDPYRGWSARRPAPAWFRRADYLGPSFNPVSFYYCFDPAGRHVDSVLADVTNTPWGERHAYLLGRQSPEDRVIRGELGKSFHVSPLMGMEQTYDWRATAPGPTLAVHIDSNGTDGKTFDATLSLERAEMSHAAMRRVLLRYPMMTAQVVGRIYWQALRLRLKGAPYHPHPRAAGSGGS